MQVIKYKEDICISFKKPPSSLRNQLLPMFLKLPYYIQVLSQTCALGKPLLNFVFSISLLFCVVFTTYSIPQYYTI